MGFKNVRVSDVTHDDLKQASIELSLSLSDTVDYIIMLGLGALHFRDSENRPVDLINEPNFVYMETGMEIPRLSNETYLDYMKRVRRTEGNLFTE